ncbi:MAG: HipA domain-containing protein [Coriobacteriia bacterium]|nr:HipA domain-containing protein [Coriobacteriia bacterium]
MLKPIKPGYNRAPQILMELTALLCNDMSQLKRLFKWMCFNVFAHNRDDHSKNFTFLYSEQQRAWRLSPAYDLTFDLSYGGEHATAVAGNGSDPGLSEILDVAKRSGISSRWAKTTAKHIEEQAGELKRNWV